MPVKLWWDGVTDGDDTADVRSICVTASSSAFRLVASYLLKHALAIPDEGLIDDGERALYNVNHDTRAKLIAIAVQMFSNDNPCTDCEDCEEMPSNFRLRQSIFNDCLLEQSFDGGVTWSTAFNMGLCVPAYPAMQTQVTNYWQTFNDTVRNYYETYNTNYTSSVTDLHPDLGYDSSPDDVLRDAALCYTLRQMVEQACISTLKFYDELDGIINGVKIAAGIAAGIAAIIGLAAGGVGAPALAGLAVNATLAGSAIALSALFGEAMYEIVTSNTRADFENEAGKSEVLCALYTMLQGADVNQDVFSVALDGLTFSGPAIGIAAVTQVLIHEEATYAAFVESMAMAMRSARVGLITIEDCPCDAGYDPCVDVYDFTINEQGWQSAGRSSNTWSADYIPGVGWRHAESDISAGVISLGIEINYGTTKFIERIEVDYVLTAAASINNTIAFGETDGAELSVAPITSQMNIVSPGGTAAEDVGRLLSAGWIECGATLYTAPTGSHLTVTQIRITYTCP